MSKLNARQQELRQRYKEFLELALKWAKETNSNDIYNTEIPKKAFTNSFRIQRGVGEYACNRYFKEFLDFTAFSYLGCKKGFFKVNYEQAEILAKAYGLEIPKPKAKGVKP